MWKIDRWNGEIDIGDIMDFTVKEIILGLLIFFFDFHKSFDSLEWDFLVSCLEAFNFGWDFIHRVKMFYNNIQSCVINNGLSSDNFRLERGVGQSDPLSHYLFLLAAEVLAVSIRQNSNMKGISIGKEKSKLRQYADDTTAVLADDNSASAFHVVCWSVI